MTREEALKIVRENYPHFGTTEPWLDLEKALATLVPELRESEDERIRKWIASYIHHGVFTEDEHPMALKAVEWLEKQKERQDNPNAHESFWSGLNTISSQDKDKNLDEIAQDYVDGVMEYNPEPTWDLMQTAVCYGYHYREQKEQKPAERFKEAREKYQVEWSEEDEEMLRRCINATFDHGYLKECDFLKSLRPQWKPSEEQMNALCYALQVMNTDLSPIAAKTYQGLQEIQQNLRKLM